MSTLHASFGTAINCIDGRTQVPVIAWMRERFLVDHVDLITSPGVDALFAEHADVAEELLKPAVQISVTRHRSRVVAVVGHDDCAANPVPPEVHRGMLLRAVAVVRTWNLGVKVIALWVNEEWQIEVVQTRSSA